MKVDYYPPKGQRYLIMFLLAFGTFINAVDRASLSVAAPVIIKDLKLDPALMGIALSAFFWPYLLLNVAAGGLADKFGSKKVLGWGAAFWSICSALTGLATNLYTMVVARIGVGIGESAAFPVNAKVTNNSFPTEERGTAVGWFTAGLRLGFAATPILMSYLLSSFGWRYAFIITGLGSLIWCVFWYFGFKENRSDIPAFSNKKTTSIPWRILLGNRTTVGLLLTKFFQDYLLYLFLTWIPAYLVMERGFSLIKMGIYASLPWMAGFVAQPLIGMFSDWLVKKGTSVTVARKSCLVTVQVISALVIAVGYIDDPFIAVLLLTVAVAAESAAGTMLWATCTEVSPKHLAGSMAGIMNTAGALAGILAPTITGFLIKFTGSFQLALAIGGCMILVAAAAVLLVIGQLKPISFELEKTRDGIIS